MKDAPIDLLYTSHNRLAFTQATFETLLDNTNWELVRQLLVIDDRSTDGTYEFLNEAVRAVPASVSLISAKTGGPAASMNLAVERGTAEILAKIDSDVVVCPTWLETMAIVLADHPNVDALGMEPGFGEPYRGDLARHRFWHPALTESAWRFLDTRTAKPARWIGGVGLIRRRVFDRGRKIQPNNRWFGWTHYQKQHVKAAWITPDLPVFLLDHVPFEPWRSLSELYIRNGWQRRWPDLYPEDKAGYWSWWENQRNSGSSPRSSVATS